MFNLWPKISSPDLRLASLQLRLSQFPIRSRHSVKLDELERLYHQPLFDLISQSREIHLRHWRGEQVQRCSLLSIKTGGCSEDCAYCAQSAHYSTVEREELLSVDEILCSRQ